MTKKPRDALVLDDVAWYRKWLLTTQT